MTFEGLNILDPSESSLGLQSSLSGGKIISERAEREERFVMLVDWVIYPVWKQRQKHYLLFPQNKSEWWRKLANFFQFFFPLNYYYCQLSPIIRLRLGD